MRNPEPEPTLFDAAVATHEMFISYVKAGFTREEALKLIMQGMSTLLQMPKQEEDREID
jgi:hypothetical protein